MASYKTSCVFNTFIQSLLWLGHFSEPRKQAKSITPPKPGKDPTFTSDQPLVHYEKTI
jgi:hypothetical protein